MPEAKWSSFQAEDQSIHEEQAEVLKEMKTSQKADTSPKHKTAIVDVNAVKHEAVASEVNDKLEEDNPNFRHIFSNH